MKQLNPDGAGTQTFGKIQWLTIGTPQIDTAAVGHDRLVADHLNHMAYIAGFRIQTGKAGRAIRLLFGLFADVNVHVSTRGGGEGKRPKATVNVEVIFWRTAPAFLKRHFFPAAPNSYKRGRVWGIRKITDFYGGNYGKIKGKGVTW